MKRHWIEVIVLAILTGGLSIAPAAVAGNDTSWIPSDPSVYGPTLHAFAFTDQSALPFQFSVLQADSYPQFQVCTSTKDPECASAYNFKYTSILKVCESPTETDCLASINALDESGKKLSGTFKNYSVSNHLNAFPADTSIGIPAGNMPGIWAIPGAPHASGNEYAIVAGESGEVNRDSHLNKFGRVIQLSVIPVVLKDFGKGAKSISQGWYQSKKDIFYDYCTTWVRSDSKNIDCSHVNGDACILPTAEQGMCYAEEPFGQIRKFDLQVRLRNEPTGWMHGRIESPEISITPTPSGVLLDVKAGATEVPLVYQNDAWANLPLNVQQLWAACYQDSRLCGEHGFFRGMSSPPAFETLNTLEGQSKVNVLTQVNPFGALPLKIMAAIAPLIGDKSNGVSSTWSVRTLSGFEMESASECITKTPGLKGIVTTNSTAYSAGPPEFKDGTLNYQVASPHFNSDGVTPFKGSYNLVMRSDVARCIYGFSSAPIKASISVISEDGQNDVATSVTNQKNGWIALSANNFQFSSPIIKVKLTQDASQAKSINCRKGKIIKKITALEPKCPKGYVKK